MAVKRIVTNIAASDLSAAQAFYGGVLGLHMVMDMGWIQTFAADAMATPQVSVVVDPQVPDISIEVDDLDETHARVIEGGYAVEYGPVVEPWDVRRFFVRDPFGRLINILTHRTTN